MFSVEKNKKNKRSCAERWQRGLAGGGSESERVAKWKSEIRDRRTWYETPQALQLITFFCCHGKDRGERKRTKSIKVKCVEQSC